MEHTLKIHSLHDAQASCSCGGWSLARTGSATREEVIAQFRLHHPRSIVVYLRKDRQERFNMKRGWFVNAWRLVDADGKDRIQPWSNTKKEALATAKACGLIVGGLWESGIRKPTIITDQTVSM